MDADERLNGVGVQTSVASISGRGTGSVGLRRGCLVARSALAATRRPPTASALALRTDAAREEISLVPDAELGQPCFHRRILGSYRARRARPRLGVCAQPQL